jgi:hypothetical protein
MHPESPNPALLTKTEFEWLTGNIQLAYACLCLRTKNKEQYRILEELIQQGKSLILPPFSQTRKPWLGFGPRTFALPRQRSTRLSYQGKCLQAFNMNLGVH